MKRSYVFLILLVNSCLLPLSLLGNPSPNQDYLKHYQSQVYFEYNKGQFETGIAFKSYVFNRQIRLLDNGISFAEVREIEKEIPTVTPKAPSSPSRKFVNYSWEGERPVEHEALVWNVDFLNTSPDMMISGKNPIPGKINYFLGKDATKWVKGASRYQEVWYENIYDGIDLRYYGNGEQQLKYDFILSAQADIQLIQLQLDGAMGFEIDSLGQIRFQTSWGEIVDAAPYSYQMIGDSEVEIDIRYVAIDERTFGFALYGPYDPTQPLVIDPITMNWTSFLHSSTSDDYVMAVKRDLDDYVYATGYTKSLSFPISPGIYQNIFGGTMDIYASKLDPNGSSLVYATYIGGMSWEMPYGLAINSQKELYIAGIANSIDFPITAGAFQNTYNLIEGFVINLGANGDSLLYSTYLGGTDRDYIYDVKLDVAGNAYVTGFTLSNDFPTTVGAYSTNLSGVGDAFVSKLSPDGSSLQFSTYFGGTSYDIGNALEVNAVGEVYVCGSSASADMPTTLGVVQSSFAHLPGNTAEDGFVVKFNATGSQIGYSTFLGGTNGDGIYSLSLNSMGEVYVAGNTFSTDFPTTGAVYQTGSSPNLGNGDVFVAKLNPTASVLDYSTYVGGSDIDFVKSIQVNPGGEAHILGATRSTNWPTTGSSPTYAAMYDVFLTVLQADGSGVVESYLLGGDYNDYPRSSSSLLLKDNKVTIGITVHSPNMPSAGTSYQSTKTNGVADAPWLVGLEVNTVLPLSVADFSASWEKNFQQTALRWTYQTDQPITSYKVERRTNHSEWEVLPDEMVEKNGMLSMMDKAAGRFPNQQLYYRIAMLDNYGQASYSETKSVFIPKFSSWSVTLSPNPATDEASLQITAGQAINMEIEIFDVRGRMIQRMNFMPDGPDSHIPLHVSEWIAGLYFVKVSDGRGSTQIQKLRVQ